LASATACRPSFASPTTSRKLEQEIVRRQAVEESLKQSEQYQIRLVDQARHMQEQLRHLSRQVLRAQEEERKRISRELHDVIAQTLTGINIHLAFLEKEAGNNKDFGRIIARTQQLVEKSVDIVHRFALELRPAVLDDLGLIPALNTFMKGFKEETGIHVSLSAFAGVEKVNGERRIVLYRVAQEALTNAARHAQASHVEVRIQKRKGAICMRIIDNGRGFQVEPVRRAKEVKRLGLLGMKERLEMVGGTFTVTTAPGKGTTVQAEVPLANDRNGEAGKISSETELICWRDSCPRRLVKIPLRKSAKTRARNGNFAAVHAAGIRRVGKVRPSSGGFSARRYPLAVRARGAGAV